MDLVTPLNRVLGLGSAKGGSEHWWAQRLSAVGLVPLGLWLAWSLLSLPNFGYTTVVAWLEKPWNGILLLLTVLTLTYHSHLGVQVVLEDYVHGRGMKVLMLMLSTFAHFVIVVASGFAILKVAFGAS